MSIFFIHTITPSGQAGPVLRYDNQTSGLTDVRSGHPVVQSVNAVQPENSVFATSKDSPAGKISPHILKISLGLSCNYACEYCSQRFVTRNDETNPEDVTDFMDSLDSWVLSPPEAIEFWGGEPLVYIKTMRPLAEALREKYPQARFSVITNGSLLNADLNRWLDDMDFAVAVSHDGPGQHVRGPDPLADLPTKQAILDLYKRLAPQGRFSFNAMVNRSNQSRAAIQAFFTELTGDLNVMIGEGGFVDAYDAGGEALSLKTDEFHSFRRQSFQDIRQGKSARIASVRDRMMSFVNSIRFNRPASSLGQKCGMDKSDAIAVDLKGNVLTCQNVSARSTAPNGESHQIGHVSDLESVALRTSTHWSKRPGCPQCPVLQICKGACMFLEGSLWERSCDNAYSDALPIFAAGIEFLTGLIPVHIEGEFRSDRKDIFGLSDQPVTPQEIKAKPFPIPVVSA